MHSEAVLLDLTKKPFVERIYLRQGEGGMATIDATIEDNGVAYDLTGCSVLFMAYDHNKKVIYETARITNARAGKVSYTVSTRLTNMEGEVRIAYFRIQNGANQITTQDIPILVLENVDLDGEQAEEYTSQFEQLLQDVQDLIADVNKALNQSEAATRAANTAAESANNANSAYSKAEAGRVAAEGVRSLNETDRVNAEAARQRAAAEMAEAEAGREAAEQRRAQAETERAGEWETLKEDVETATENANDAAKAANDAAQRSEDATEAATEAADRANRAAASTERAIADATNAAGQAEIAASASRAATDRLNDAMAGFNSETGTEIAYAIGDSSTAPPTTGWTAAQQETPQGKFQWVRTITHYYKGPDTVKYSIAYQGKDGKDGVTTEINGLYWFNVEDDELVVYYHDEDNPPQFEIQDRMLYAIYETEE